MAKFVPGQRLTSGQLSGVADNAKLGRAVRLGPGIRGFGTSSAGSAFAGTDYGSLVAEVRLPIVFTAWAAGIVHVAGDVRTDTAGAPPVTRNYRCIQAHTAAVANQPSAGGLATHWLRLATCYDCYLRDPSYDSSGDDPTRTSPIVATGVPVWCDDGGTELPANTMAAALRSKYGEWYMRDPRSVGGAGADTDWMWFTMEHSADFNPGTYALEPMMQQAPNATPTPGYYDMEAGTCIAIRVQRFTVPPVTGTMTFSVGKVSGGATTWSAKTLVLLPGVASIRRDDIDDLTLIAGDRLIMQGVVGAGYTSAGAGYCLAAARFVPSTSIDPTVDAPKRATMWHHQATALVGPAIVFGTTHVDMFGGRPSYQISLVDGNSFTNSCFLKAGTYTFWVLGRSSAAFGKVDWYCDGVKFATGQDWYSAATIQSDINPACVEAGAGVGIPLTVATDGYHVFKGQTNGRNGANNTAYHILLTDYWVKPAAD